MPLSPRTSWAMVFAGLGLTAAGVVLLRRQQLGLGAGPLSPRLVTKRALPAGVVSTTRSGGMVVQHRRSRNMSIEERVSSIQDMVYKSTHLGEMRKLALGITRHCPERDKMCEAKAVYDYTKRHVRYTGDIAPIKMGVNGPVEAIDLYQRADRTLEFGGGDCLPQGTLLLTEGHKFVAIEDLIIGQKIWGRDDWTEVKDVWFKGSLPVDAVHLNNGSMFKATGDHKVYVALCSKHRSECDCAFDTRGVDRLRVSQLEPGMVLIQPKQVFGLRRNVDVLRVVSAARSVSEAPVYDISTSDHYVYLPEADVTVSNCDDQAIVNATLLGLNGIPARLRVTAEKGAGREYSHIYTVAMLSDNKGVALDTTLPGNNRFNFEVPYGASLDFPA